MTTQQEKTVTTAPEVRVPIYVKCPDCNGFPSYSCAKCEGMGMVVKDA